MSNDKSLGRMTLRQLLATAEKGTRDLVELCQRDLLPRTAEFRELTRPVRRRSQYPTLHHVSASMNKMQEANDEVQEIAKTLLDQLDAIRDLAQREKVSRM